MTEKKAQPNMKQRGMSSLLLLLLALVSISLTSLAWFTIADNTRLRGITMDVTTGPSLRFDLDAHSSFYDYIKTLNFSQIAARVKAEKGFSISETPLEPVTTNDTKTFTFENGDVVSDTTGCYLTFTLHFMAKEEMIVHLTSATSRDGDDGTLISSNNTALANSMRISFTINGETIVYDPGMGAASTTENGMKTFGLPSADNMEYTDDNALFAIAAETDTPVLVHIWLEGTDESCTNELKGSDYSIALRFQGTDENNNVLLEG